MTLDWKKSLKEELQASFKIIIKHDRDGKNEVAP